jgi:hypothetical protein
MNCGEEREMAAHGLCFKCYRAEERAIENPWGAADKHSRVQLKAQGVLRKAVTSILNAVDAAIDYLAETDVTTIRNICGGYLAGMAAGLITRKDDGAVNGEHDDMPRSPEVDEEPEVNSEQVPDVNSSLPEEGELDTVNGKLDDI